MSAIAIGDTITWTRPDRTKRTGRVTGIRESGTTMETRDGDFRGIQYQIDYDEWTLAFPDREHPVGRVGSSTGGDPKDGNDG